MSIEKNNKNRVKNNVVEVLQQDLIEKHYEIISSSWKQTVVAILHTAQCVYTAKRELNNASFKSLASRFGGVATLSKLITIGEHTDALKIHVSVLPNSWTSMYHLARLAPEKLAECVAKGQINPWMTGSSAAQLLDAPPASSAANLVSIIVKSDDETLQAHSHEFAEIVRSLKDNCQKLKSLGLTVKEVIQDVTENRSLAA